MTQNHQEGDCQQVFYQLVGVGGEVTVTPKLECGPVEVTCLETKVSRGHVCTDDKSGRPENDGKCRLTIFQELCVAIPVTFRAKTECRLTDVHCGPASTDPGICYCDECDSHESCSSSSSSSSSSGTSCGSCSNSGSSSGWSDDGSDSSDSSSDEE